jgi:hypothetical protein
MALAVKYSIWFGYISRISRRGGRGVFYVLKVFLPAFAAATLEGGGKTALWPEEFVHKNTPPLRLKASDGSICSWCEIPLY